MDISKFSAFNLFHLFWQIVQLIPIIALIIFIYKKIFSSIIRFFKNISLVILLSFTLFSCEKIDDNSQISPISIIDDPQFIGKFKKDNTLTKSDNYINITSKEELKKYIDYFESNLVTSKIENEKFTQLFLNSNFFKNNNSTFLKDQNLIKSKFKTFGEGYDDGGVGIGTIPVMPWYSVNFSMSYNNNQINGFEVFYSGWTVGANINVINWNSYYSNGNYVVNFTYNRTFSLFVEGVGVFYTSDVKNGTVVFSKSGLSNNKYLYDRVQMIDMDIHNTL
ncbi:hypothetical protein G9H64_06890 [Aquirufa nivalisilvae]|uniref:hypothetical protein n=1 Tax=Aquirufa nivalisilvae TaxID=2516557 RepID=UPI0022A902ED|nr:hypothetical protein [Aquirufa nivalisilvae]MCZ2482677.1 hypothetical protein [Aquirufa nivalisilvae]